LKPGDVVQFSVILKHLAKYRPDWIVDVRCGRGKHTALIGQCNRVWHDQEDKPPGPYDTDAVIGWYENYSRFEDRPNSKITNCLSEVFGITYDPSLGSYQVYQPIKNFERARGYYCSIGAEECAPGRFRVVLLHYEGNTSTWKKNLKHWQARLICAQIRAMGRIPVILDWDRRSPLPDQKTIFCPTVGDNDLWGNFGSGDASMIACLVSCAEAYIGIDSGPGKCASATNTPTLISWMEHSPLQFHDPSSNTTHLVPHEWKKIPPCERIQCASYFEKHYKFTTYRGEFGLVDEALNWLATAIHEPMRKTEDSLTYICPNGIGDILWVLHKIRGIAGDRPIDLLLSCSDPGRELNRRALPFIKRFPFVRSCDVTDMPILRGHNEHDRNDQQGRWNYFPDGERAGVYYLVPNKILEAGGCLEEWYPDIPVDWSVVDSFDWSNTEKGDMIADALGDFVAFYLGPESGNVDEGQNRGFLWEPRHWVDLGMLIQQHNLKIALVGAGYDRSYWERYVRDGVKQAGMKWFDLVGKLEIGETMKLLRHCKAFVSYQCGLGIFLHYLGGNVVMWWRPDGDSAHPKRLVAFDERMATTWCNPKYADRYMGLIYTRCTPESVHADMKSRGWLD
jgi:hypothetical protein